jgi:hypothetical protein
MSKFYIAEHIKYLTEAKENNYFKGASNYRLNNPYWSEDYQPKIID